MDATDVREAHERLLALVGALTDDEARRPSLLPEWSVGHVVTHLARNADSFTWLVEGALAGEVRDQYPGGWQQRQDDIEVGAGRPAADLVDDLRAACGRLEDALQTVVDPTAPVRTSAGEVPVGELRFRRVREVEIHRSDLGLGATWEEWPDGFVDAQVERLAAAHRRHLVAFLAGRAGPPPGLFG